MISEQLVQHLQTLDGERKWSESEDYFYNLKSQNVR